MSGAGQVESVQAVSERPDTRPALWNPTAAALWSLLFTPAFGSYLHALNADTLGRTEEAKTNRLFFYTSLGYLVFVLVSTFIPQIPETIFRAAAAGLLVGWYVAAGRKQAQDVKAEWQNTYLHKGWTKPLLIAATFLVGYFAVLFALILAADVFFGIE